MHLRMEFESGVGPTCCLLVLCKPFGTLLPFCEQLIILAVSPPPKKNLNLFPLLFLKDIGQMEQCHMLGLKPGHILAMT